MKRYKGKGEHSVMELESLMEEREECIHELKIALQDSLNMLESALKASDNPNKLEDFNFYKNAQKALNK